MVGLTSFRYIYAVWFLLLSLLIKADGQEKIDFTKPFIQCWVFGREMRGSKLVASDNESQIIIIDGNNTIISLNSATGKENWKTQIGGKLYDEAFNDESSLFVSSKFGDDNKKNETTLLSISLKTGTPNWQHKFSPKETEINHIPNKSSIFVSHDTKIITALDKSSGQEKWEISTSTPIIKTEAFSENSFLLLTNDELLKVSTDTGKILDRNAVKNPLTSIYELNESYYFQGDKSGELIKKILKESQNIKDWKIKVGASISGIYELEKGVLVTSFDNFIYFFSKDRGNLKWKKRLSGRILSKPLFSGNTATIINGTDSSALIIDLNDGKTLNQLSIPEENLFTGVPLQVDGKIIFETLNGVYTFSNSSDGCQ